MVIINLKWNCCNDPMFIPPDAILVSDLGLISYLKSTHPRIELHASTQTGAYSLDDVLFYESLGFKRVVLARELNLDEIKYIREHTNVELEVFVYGDNDISFSGNCLWGGLLHLGSGNRGRCVGMCYDVYTSPSKDKGCYFYTRGIGLFGTVKKLQKIGINCVKIEGRTRPIDEIRETVCKFRRAIDLGDGKDKDDYQGYLGGMSSCMKQMVTELKDTPGKAIFYQKLEFDNVNIRIGLLYHNNHVSAVDYVSCDGERQIFDISISQFQIPQNINTLWIMLKKGIEANIYEFLSEKNFEDIVLVDVERFNEIIQIINENIRQARPHTQQDTAIPV